MKGFLITLKNFFSYWRFHIATILLLVCCAAIPVILSGIYNGQHFVVKGNIEEAKGGAYTIYAYWDGNSNKSVITLELKDEIDKIMKDSFSDYIGSSMRFRSKLELLINRKVSLKYGEIPNSYKVMAWVEMDESLEEDVFHIPEYAKKKFHDIELLEYSTDSHYGKGYVKFAFVNRKKAISDNPLMQTENEFFSAYPDLLLNWKTAGRILSFPEGAGTELNLEFSRSHSYAEVKKALSKHFSMYNEPYRMGKGTLIFKNPVWNGVKLFFPDLDGNLAIEISNITQNGQADSEVQDIVNKQKEAQFLALVMGLFSDFASFVMLQSSILFRKDEISTLRLIGGNRSLIIRRFAVEQIILSCLALLLSWLIVRIVAWIWQSKDVTDLIALYFCRDGHFVFIPKRGIVLIVIAVVIGVPQLAMWPVLIPVINMNPALIRRMK
ncbi:MAG: FtsX-like permease family protein [Sphaerochaetaceae bacterium]